METVRGRGPRLLRAYRSVRARALIAAAVAVVAAFMLAASPGWAGPPSGPIARQGTRSAVELRVIPFPGTPDASPSSQVIFSALRPSDLRTLTVTGSHSGRHPGRLEALPAGAGTAFVSRHPFTPGETVRVSASLSSPHGGTVSGDPGARRLVFSFGVGMPVNAPSTGLIPGPGAGTAEGGGWMASDGHAPTQHFRSAPGLQPPVVNVTRDPDRRSGDLFLAPLQGGQAGPMILDSRGRLVWFRPLSDPLALNFAVQRYRHHPVLTWAQGEDLGGGADVIMDRSYRTVAVVHPGNGYQLDLHEFQITPQGTALITCFGLAHANLASVGGPADGTVADGIIQEVDIRTGKVLWEWHALGHVPLSASYQPYDPKALWYDYFHLNSIQQLPGGNLLISARNTWAVYEISHRTGRVIWTLGGKDSSFKMGPGTDFEWQHDARLRGRKLSVLDDAADPQEERQSSAKLLRLDTQTGRVSLVKRFTHSPPLLAGAGGNAQLLPNGNWLVGWGSNPQFSEYTPTGRQIFNGTFPLGEWSYRAFRFPWRGQPLTRPSLAVFARPDGSTKLYASWNGATLLRAWRVLGGSGPGALKPLGVQASRSGFETTIRVPDAPRYFAVQALGGKGRRLRTSAPLTDPSHLAIFGSSIFVPASGGYAGVPVGCSSAQNCRVNVTVTARGAVLGRSNPEPIVSYRGRLVYVRLRGPGRRLLVQVTVSGASHPSVTRAMTLIPYSASPSSRDSQVSDAPGVRLVSATGFVSSTGRAAVLEACYSDTPCHVKESVSARGQELGHADHVLLGADELAYVEIQLDQAGRSKLAHARGNRLPAQLELRTGRRSVTSEISLVHHS